MLKSWWQNEIYEKNVVSRTGRFFQDSYALINLMACHKVNNNPILNFNLNKLFNDKCHLATTNSYYGAPTNFRVGVKYE